MKVKVAQSCPTLCDFMDCIVHGIFQARVPEWVAFPFSRGSSQPRDRTQVAHIGKQSLYQLSHRWSPRILEWVACPFSSRSSRPRETILIFQFSSMFYVCACVCVCVYIYIHTHIYIQLSVKDPYSGDLVVTHKYTDAHAGEFILVISSIWSLIR